MQAVDESGGTNSITLLVLGQYNARFYDTLVVDECGFDAFFMSKFAKFEITPKLINFVFNIGKQVRAT